MQSATAQGDALAYNPFGYERRAIGMRAPELPLPEAAEAHRRTHVPYAAWCEECVAGRGWEPPPQTLSGACGDASGGMRFPFLLRRWRRRQIEYCPSLVMADCETTYATASVVPNEGQYLVSVGFGVLFLQELGHPRMVLMTDGEPSIIAWAAAVQREWAKEDTEQRQQLISRQGPRGSHASNGHAETWFDQ